MRWAWLAGIFFAIDLELYHHTIRLVGAGLATVLGNTQVVFVAVLAWLLLRERLPLRTALAIPLVLAGVTLISGVIGSGAYGENPQLGVVVGLATGLSYAAFLLILRHGNADLRQPAGPLFDATLSATLVALLIGLPLGELELVPSWPAHGYLLALALSSQVLGWLLISVSLPRLPAALTSVVLTLQPVGAVLLAMLILRRVAERDAAARRRRHPGGPAAGHGRPPFDGAGWLAQLHRLGDPLGRLQVGRSLDPDGVAVLLPHQGGAHQPDGRVDHVPIRVAEVEEVLAALDPVAGRVADHHLLDRDAFVAAASRRSADRCRRGTG